MDPDVEEVTEEQQTNETIHSYPGGKRRSRVWKFFGFYKKASYNGPSQTVSVRYHAMQIYQI